MDETRRQVEASIAASTRAGQSIEDILRGMDDMGQRIALIANSAESQSATAEQISSSEKEIALIAGRTEQGAAQAAQATHELAKLSQELLSLVVRLVITSYSIHYTKLYEERFMPPPRHRAGNAGRRTGCRKGRPRGCTICQAPAPIPPGKGRRPHPRG